MNDIYDWAPNSNNLLSYHNSAVIVVKVTPVIVANLKALSYYCKTFGIINGIGMWYNFGAAGLPNGIISVIQMDMQNGDTSADDFFIYGKETANSTPLYRAVCREEYNEFINAKSFSYYPNAMKSKWFATSYEDCVKWANKFYSDKYYIIQLNIPAEALNNVFFTSNLDGIGDAYCFSIDKLNMILQNFVN